ncbi:MAG: LysM peptidoglycan-binding domain-containing protein [Peptococcaceae bacterium]|nr:LysM peptidoglycan-binding domain-containing protein [Peptococcaceae bacterium]
MEIYLTQLDNGTTVSLSMLPEQIQMQAETRFASYDIMSMGEVRLPVGEKLKSFSWQGVLPGEGRKKQSYLAGRWQSPKEIQEIFSLWRVTGAKLRLLITETPINEDVYLASYQMTYMGGYGDYQYQIQLIARKELGIKAKRPTANAAYNSISRANQQQQASYTVKTGDSLWSIAQKVLGQGSRYGEIYQLNQGTIDSRNKKGGNKYQIYPGQILKMPG